MSVSVMILTVVIGLFLATPLMAWNKLGKVRDHLEMKQYSEAYELLKGEKGILKKSPKNLPAQILLGVYYLGARDDSRADERFELVLKQDARFAKDISKAYKDAAQDASDKKSVALAKTRFQKAIAHNPVLVNQASLFFVKLGDHASGNLAVECYRTALYYAKDQEAKAKIAYRLLRLAAQGIQTELIKKEVALIIGQAKVDEIFPKPRMETVFVGTYTDVNANQKGWIRTIDFKLVGKKLRLGDKIEVIGKASKNINLNTDLQVLERGKWNDTDHGYYHTIVEFIPDKGYFYLKIKRDKGIEATVKVVRKIYPKPRKDLLASL